MGPLRTQLRRDLRLREPNLAGRIQIAGEDARLSVERKTLRVELLDTIKRQALEVRGGAAEHDWGMLTT
jgi:hypothetical protein